MPLQSTITLRGFGSSPKLVLRGYGAASVPIQTAPHFITVSGGGRTVEADGSGGRRITVSGGGRTITVRGGGRT